MTRAGSWDVWCAPAEDNVRQSPVAPDRRACGYNPWRGKVVDGAHGRAVRKGPEGNQCAVCRFTRKYGTHCFLTEVCDRCAAEDPQQACVTSQEMARQSGMPGD